MNGAAAGGGSAIALAADTIVIGESATFHSAFIKVGISGSELGVSWRLQRTIGVARAREMLLTGHPMSAADDSLVAYGHAPAEDMLRAAPDALRVTQRTCDAALEIGSFDAALEFEERGQIIMVRARNAGS